MPKVAFPHLGMIYVPMQVLFRQLDIEVVVPPLSSSRSLALGSRYSPEFVCIPYKLVLGNFLEGLDRGADTLILLAGPNNCRFGYYSRLQSQVLQELGYHFEMLTPQISSRTINGVTDILRRLSGNCASRWDCLRAIMLALGVLRDLDEIERQMQWVRARELRTGDAQKVFEEASLALTAVESPEELKKKKLECLDRLADVSIDRGHRPLRVSLVGEIYVTHEPFINRYLEKELGKKRVEVTRSEQLSQWLVISPALLLEAAGLGHEAKIARAAQPYLEHLHGETIGQTVIAARDGFDGVIHLTPFTCTPEIVNLNVLGRLRQDWDIPVLSLVLDEQSGDAGLFTRLEAFLDLLKRRH